jgi:hypothetical protein
MLKFLRVIELKAVINIHLMFTTEEQKSIRAPTAIGLYIDGGALFLFLFLGKQKKKNRISE